MSINKDHSKTCLKVLKFKWSLPTCITDLHCHPDFGVQSCGRRFEVDAVEAWYVGVVSKVTKDEVLLFDFFNHLVYGIQNFHCHHLAFQTKAEPYISSHLYWLLDTLKMLDHLLSFDLHVFFKFCLMHTGRQLTAVNFQCSCPTWHLHYRYCVHKCTRI